jgi:group I intron endonuclease
LKYLYIIHNSVNDKKYVGVSIRPDERFKQHKRREGCPALRSAMKKYGTDKFSMELLCVGDAETIDQLEIEAIQLFNSVTPNGYNVSLGGEGAKYIQWSDEQDNLLYTLNNITVAKLLNIDQNTVARRRRFLGIPNIPQDFSCKEFNITKDVEEIFRDTSITINTAARKVGCDKATVSKFRKKHNIGLDIGVRKVNGDLVKFELTEDIIEEYKEGKPYKFFKEKYGISRSLFNRHRSGLKLTVSNAIVWTEDMLEVLLNKEYTVSKKARLLGLNYRTVEKKLRKIHDKKETNSIESSERTSRRIP